MNNAFALYCFLQADEFGGAFAVSPCFGCSPPTTAPTLATQPLRHH